MRKKYLLSSAIFLAATFSGRASESVMADTIADQTEKISTVTVTAYRMQAKLSAALPVQMLYADNLRALGVNDMADAVSRFAGVNVRDYGGLGGLKTVSVRNMGASHTAVSYDGVPVSNCQAGQIDIGRFSLDNVSSISLAVGHDVDLLQPARLYASAAVLSITTQRPAFESGRNYSWRFEVKGGSFGYVSPSVRWNQRLTDKLCLSIDGSFMRADGNYPFQLENGHSITTEKRYNSAVKSYHTEANIYYSPAENSSLDLKGYYSYSDRGLPGAVTLYNPVSTETLIDKNGFFQATYNNRFSDRWKLRISAKYNYGFNADRETGPQFTDGIYAANHTQHEYFLTAAAQYSPISGLDIALAQDGFYNTLSSTLAQCPYPKRFTSLTALNIRYRLGIVTLNGSLVNTFITEHTESGVTPDDMERLSPSLSFSLKPIGSRNFHIRGFYKSTFRTPSFNDLYYDRLGNRSLRPEKASEFDLGVTWSGSLFPAMNYLSVTADGYFNLVNDKIVAFPTTYAWRMANYGKVHIAGADITLATSVRLSRNVDLTVTGAYTFQKAIDVTSRSENNYRHQLPYTPRNSGNIGVTIDNPWVTFGYSLTGVGERYFMSQNIPAYRIKGYVDQSVTLSHEFRAGAVTIGLRGELLNIFNRQYEVIKYYPMPGRSWRIGATVKF